MKFLSIFLSLFASVAWAQEVDTLHVAVQDSVAPTLEEVTPPSENVQNTVEVSSELVFGYFSYDEALRFMPEYSIVKTNLDNLSKQFKDEAARSEAEFNKKYEAFLDEQRDLAPSILKKRQAELQDMMERNIAFKEEAQRLMVEAENEGFAPLRSKLSMVLNKVGKEQGLAFILNTDQNSVPYINESVGVDINMLIKKELQGGRRR